MWISSEIGLNRYDGYEIKVYKYNTDNSMSVSGNLMMSNFTEDHQGGIWIGTWRRGLNRYNPATDKFTRFLYNPDDPGSISSNRVRVTYMGHDSVLWIGTYDGLNSFDDKTGKFAVYKQVPMDSSNLLDRIESIYEDKHGVFWIGTHNGLYQFDRKNKTFSSFDLVPKLPEGYRTINFIFEDHTQLIWIGTDAGLYSYNRFTRQMNYYFPEIPSYETGISNDYPRCMVESYESGTPELWISTNHGLNRFERRTNSFTKWYHDPDNPFSLSSSFLHSMFLDNNGLLWIASFNGVNILDIGKKIFNQIREDPYVNKFRYTMRSFCQSNTGDYWIGTYSDGLFRYDSDLNLMNHFYFKGATDPCENVKYSKNSIPYIFEDTDHTLWVGTQNSGVNIFNRKSEKLEEIVFITPESHEEGLDIRQIYEDSRGVLWFGTNIGLYQKNNNDSIGRVNHPVLSFCGINQVLEDWKGDIWVGTQNNGLYCLPAKNRATNKFLKQKYKLPRFNLYGPSVRDIYEDNEGTLWFAMLGALYSKESHSDTLIMFDRIVHLCLQNTFVILEDNSHNLWLYTKYGLYRFNPHESLDRILRLYDVKDGLPFDELGFFAFYKDNKGRFFVGGRRSSNSGFVYFDPDSIKETTMIPPVVLTDFKVRNEPFPLDSNITSQKQIHLKHNQNFFSFEFAALDYTNPEKNKYSFKLEGFDDDWIYSANRRYANYTGVPPGHYTFRAKGTNHDGYWNEEGTSVRLTILPPPWKTWWAYSIYGLLLISMIYVWRRYDLKRQRLKQELELEHIQTEKLEDLDRMKSQFFANISHEFRTPLTLILGPLRKILSENIDEQARQDLNMMQRNANRLQRLINQLLSLSKLESGKMKLQARERDAIPLIRGYVQSFESLAKQKGIDLIFKEEGESISFWVDQEKLEKILFNLLSNAFKFTHEGGTISVTVSPPLAPPEGGGLLSGESVSKGSTKSPPFRGDGRGVMISVTDTGKGIPKDQLEHIFDRFFQADDSYTKDGEGTGIGLALTKELVELHHGKIEVESEVGTGTSFRIYLPLGKEHLKPEEIGKTRNRKQETRKKETLNPSTTLGAGLEPRTIGNEPIILIVEDNADLRLYIRGYLDQTYQVVEAKDGRQGLKSAIKYIPDLIISDVMMPEMDGYELCSKLKTDERTSHIPVILLTARASMESKIEGLETGADDFITKPFDPQELQIRVKNLIHQRSHIRNAILKEFSKGKKETILNISFSGLNEMDRKFILKALGLIEEHLLDTDFDVERFSREMALSHSQLHRKLKAIMNLPVTGFIRMIRLNKAAELLRKKSGNVSEIAYDVGFNTLPYFTKCFMEQFGVTPTEYGGETS